MGPNLPKRLVLPRCRERERASGAPQPGATCVAVAGATDASNAAPGAHGRWSSGRGRWGSPPCGCPVIEAWSVSTTATEARRASGRRGHRGLPLGATAGTTGARFPVGAIQRCHADGSSRAIARARESTS